MSNGSGLPHETICATSTIPCDRAARSRSGAICRRLLPVYVTDSSLLCPLHSKLRIMRTGLSLGGAISTSMYWKRASRPPRPRRWRPSGGSTRTSTPRSAAIGSAAAGTFSCGWRGRLALKAISRSLWPRQLSSTPRSTRWHDYVTPPWTTNPEHRALREKTLNFGPRCAGFSDE